MEQSTDYNLVKKEILRAYELVPEAYRQRFRDAKCQDSQTYMEFAREKETLFNKWCASQQMGNNFDKLKQLILLEEFKKCVTTPIKTYLEEQKVTDLQRVASLADDYKLTHKSSTTVPESKTVKIGSNVDSTRPQQRNIHGQRSGPTCAYCKKRGHLMSECWILQKKEHKTSTLKGTKPISSVSSFKAPSSYQPFISSGYLSIQENSPPITITILRDTGASQSLLAEGVAPLSNETATGDNVLISGVELGFASVPLHKVFLKSDLISGYVTVGVRPDLPVKGVSLLLGNDLAGDKVMVNPHVSSLPNVLSDTEMQDIPGLYPACAVTHAMAKKHLTTSQDIHLNNNAKSDVQSLPSSSSIGDGDHELVNTFMTHLDELSEDNVVGGTQGTPAQLEMSMNGNTSLTEQLMRAQETDPELEPQCIGCN